MSDLGQDEQGFIADIRRFVDEHMTGSMRRKSLAERPLSREEADAWQRALFAQGWAAPAWPRDYGGTGWSLERQHVFKREMGRLLAPSGPMFGLQMVGPVIYTFGSPEQKRRHLPGILTNDVWWCQGFSEPGAGSDLAAIKTGAVRDGERYVINGQKIWTSYAHMADMIFLLARTSSGTKRQDGISFFVFDIRAPGIEVRPIVSMNGSHSLNEVFFDNVAIPLDSLIGEEGKGWSYAKFLLGNERLGIANLPRLWQRFGQLSNLSAGSSPDGVIWSDDPAFRQKLVALRADLHALEAFEAEAIRRVATRTSGGADMSILKVCGTELLQRADRLLFDISGCAGSIYVTAQTAIDDRTGWKALTGRMLHGRAASIYGGTNEIQRDIIARATLDGSGTAVSAPFSEEDVLLKAAVDRFVQRNPASRSCRAGARDEAAPRQWRELADLGWLASPLPEDAGGLGGTPVQTTIIAEGLGRSLIVHSYPETAVCAGTLLASARSPLVERLISGDMLVATAINEASLGGGDAPLVAHLMDGKTILRGLQPRVLSADRASHLLVAARSAVDGATLLLLLDARQPGVEIEPLLLLDGRTAADLAFVNAEVGSDAIIAQGADAEAVVAWARDYAALTVCAEAIGCMEGALDLVRGHLQTRHQFGVAIGSNQVLRHRFADMYARFEQARAAVFSLARRLHNLTSASRHLESALLKTFVCEASRFIGEQSIQLHGGMGMTDEHVIGRYYKRLLVLETMFGNHAASLRAGSANQKAA
jgi:alkylation response protein AidB-like acyl-CoA dehydrogenase